MKTTTKITRPSYIRWSDVADQQDTGASDLIRRIVEGEDLVLAHKDEGGNLTAYLCREGDRFVMRSGWIEFPVLRFRSFGAWFATTDEHILAVEFTNEQRLAAHWDGFVANCS